MKLFLKKQKEEPIKKTEGKDKKPVFEKTKRTKAFIYGLLLVIVAGLGLCLYTQNNDVDDANKEDPATSRENTLVSTDPLDLELTDGSQLYRVSENITDEGDVHAVVELFNQETNSFEIFDNSKTLRDFKVSEDGRYVAKIDDGAVYLAETAEPLDFKEVLPPAAEPTTNNQLVWLSDSSGFLVRNMETISGQSEGPGAIREHRFTVSRYDIAEKSTVELFTHREVMGGIHIVDTDSERDELYWYTAGEGGRHDHLHINRISDGEEVTVNPYLPEGAHHTQDDMFIRDGIVYYRATMPDYYTGEHIYLNAYDIDEDRSWPVFGRDKFNEAENSSTYSKPNIQWAAPGANDNILTMLNVADGDDSITGVYELNQRPGRFTMGDTLLRGSGSYYLSYHEGTFENIGTFITTYCPEECEEERTLYLLRNNQLQAVPATIVNTNGTIYLTSFDN